ncbi:H/ACA ribonucleoprotein complex subunit 2, putative [Medicago truncatula]|uniref:H/ACA ribonucleoprotein complex subunit 2, putative n=1 Tax=Medicago truncatula TaxID=3880 RepID=G7KG02_MEDTR|nr:H/ACA ribonucleoprotein complex subunit 2, putative [Medicago truncatula]
MGSDLVLEEKERKKILLAPASVDLATAGATKRPKCCVLVMTRPLKGELSQDVQENNREKDECAFEMIILTE